MSPDEFALMQAIRANPPDNTPRLVYADYLEERGDESNIARAEFIRVQCVLAKGNFEADEREQYRNRESQLLDSYGERWVQQLRAAIHKLEPKYGPAIFSRLKVRSYDRGMIASATILSRLFAVFPDIQHLVGPIQHLEVVDARGMPPLKRSADGNRKWDLKCLKVLSLQEFPDDGNNRAPASYLQMMDEIWNVPILDLSDSHNGLPCTDDLGRSILRGQLNPVVILPIRGLTNRPFVFDPLDLWPLVHSWAESYVPQVRRLGVLYETWSRTEADIRAIPSARLPHLVRYYRLAGLPQPAGLAATLYPNEERMLPKRSILTRAARWIRGKR